MSDYKKLIQLFKDLTTFATPESSAKYFQKNNVIIQKHGRWKDTGMHFLPYQCSACETLEEGRTNYCPNCGAKMDGGADNGL